MRLKFSCVIPVYNRPEEIRELLESFRLQGFTENYEIVIVEDGSTQTSEHIITNFPDLSISYYYKSNSGPGPSRNYGMQRASGDYFIILDSDCVLPPEYLQTVAQELDNEYVDFFGGPDAAHSGFTTIQKSINYSMTSLYTTGGIRGRNDGIDEFQPRSFNMGISKAAFEASGGFGKIHPGEDPDLSFRLWKLGYKSRLIQKAFVYHKRRISLKKFYHQIRKFGLVRPILNQWHPGSAKITYWLPTLFLFFGLGSVVAVFCGFFIPIYFLLFYLLVLLVDATVKNQNMLIGLGAVLATLIQFTAYGIAFLQSTFFIRILGKDPRRQFPHLFFD